jgi:hypothetical protein
VELSSYFLPWLNSSSNSFASSPSALRTISRASVQATSSRSPTRPDGNPWGWGCGNAENDQDVPDNWKDANFIPGCRNHDVCYGTCKTDKSACDKGLHMDLRAACSAAYGGSSAQRANLSTCQQVAFAYYQAVSRLGQASYDAAQKEACAGCARAP